MSQLKVNTIRHTGASSDAITLASDGTATIGECTAKITNNLSNRRININGAMSVSQRGDVTGITNGTSAQLCYGGPDRYKLYVSSHGTYTISQEEDAPDGFDQSLKVLTTGQDASLGSSARVYIQHKIEKNDLIRTKKGTSGALALAVQFWVKSSETGTYIFEMWDNQNNRHISSTYAISSADTWEKKTMTFAGDTGGSAFSAGTGSGIDCNWWLAAGSSFTSGSLASSWTSNTDANRAVGSNVNIAETNHNWFMTGFQIETGDTVTDFEYRNHAEELASCQRYYFHQGSDGDYGYTYSDNDDQWFDTVVHFPVTMRASPTSVINSGDASDYYIRRDSSKTCSGGPNFNTAGTKVGVVRFGSASHGWGTAQPCRAFPKNSDAFIGWPAEL